MSMGKRKTSLGCLFWIALILFILVVFFFNRDRINQILEETGFLTYIGQPEERTPEIERKELEEEAKEEKSRPEARPNEESPSDQTIEITIEKEEKEEEEVSAEKEEPKIDQKLRKSTVYFVAVDEDGAASLKKTVRPVYYRDSPLTATMYSLLEGLTPSELNEGLLNLIPADTKIHRIWIEGSTAYIDFSEDLRFNPFSTEGLEAALQQIVYTATEFSTVDRVQILINGEKRSYLSSEGIRIDAPLSREDVLP